MLFVAALTFSLCVGVFGSPSRLLTVQKFNDKVNPNSFIVKLRPGKDKAAHLAALRVHLRDSQITHDYDPDFFNAFAGTFSNYTLDMLRASADVEYIEEDGIVHTMATTTQVDAPWGLSRLSQDGRVSGMAGSTNFRYSYDSTAGAGVDIYGVGEPLHFLRFATNSFFTQTPSDFGGRARFGAVFGPYAPDDGNGHGTHTAATAAGTRWGVAKAAQLIAVKVLSDQGSGAVADIISGLNFVATSARSTGRPSVVIIALGGSVSASLDNACTSLVDSGIHVTATAGGDNADAANFSPGRVSGVNTIGASTISDARASFSNFGAAVDIFAPGADITSAWIGSISASETISGTSMATAHVAGLTAYLIGVNGNAPPANITNQIHILSLDGILSGIPSGTRNELARNDIKS